MKIPEEIVKSALLDFFDKTLLPILPEMLKNVVLSNALIQDCIAIADAAARYKLSKKTIYNYYHKGYIRLYSSEGKTFVSISELDRHIKANPLPPKVN